MDGEAVSAAVRCTADSIRICRAPGDADRTAAAFRRPAARGGEPPHLAGVTYAATATATLICLGFASSRSGSRTVSTPALYSALTLPTSTVGGSVNDRAKEP